MASTNENEELPILVPVPEARSRAQTRALHSRNRSVSFSHSTYSTNRVDNSSGPLRTQRAPSPSVQMSGPLYSTRRPDQSYFLPSPVQPPESSSISSSTVDVPSEEDEVVLKNEKLLKSGQLGMCNDPYCTTCPSYYNRQTAQFHTYRLVPDSRIHTALYGDARGWAKRFASSVRRCVPGIINPHSKFVQMWNRFLAYSCLLAIFIDPAFVFLLYMRRDKNCTEIDWPKAYVFVFLRSMSDLIFCINILLQFRLAYVAPESRIVGAGQLVDHPGKIAFNYFIGKFTLDLLIVIPLPQRMILSILPSRLGTPRSEFEKNTIIAVFLFQYIPKLYRLLPLIAGQSPTGFIFESAWANFIINLLTFILAGHAVGSFWYLAGLQRVKKCLLQAGNFTMYQRSNLIDWLLLFARLIGNMHNFLQALDRRRMEMMLRRRDVEQWMSHRLLPENIRKRVREAERFNWAATRGVNEELIFENMPDDLQRDIKRHLFKFLKKVRIFSLMDESFLDAIRERLKQRTYIRNSTVLRRKGLVEKMVFIVSGEMESIGEDGSVLPLSEGDVCGEELLTWCLDRSSVNRDGTRRKMQTKGLVSNRSVRCVTNVEAFSLSVADLEDVTSLFS
ncbi:hypothetical protein Bca4012_084922 [Brassica carinata]